MEKPFVYDSMEMDKLAEFLDACDVKYTRAPIYKGEQIRTAAWDAVCHEWSYGGASGLLETYGAIVPRDEVGDSVEGCMTAREVALRFAQMVQALANEVVEEL